MESERRSERYPSHRPLSIRCETWNEFVETYASDICRGGMFIRSEQTPEVLSEVELKLILPAGMEVALNARVVHVVPLEVAEQHNRIPGMGVEFILADAEQKRQILQLVEFARAQREGGDPEASFARTLLETSASMPAREVAARLSMLPDGADANRARKASQTAMQAVQLNDEAVPERPDPSRVAVRSRPNTAALERQRILRTETQPLTDSTRISGARPATQPIARTPTGPLTSANAAGMSTTGRSSTNLPIVRTATQPIARPATGPVARAPTSPIARTATAPLTAADRANSTAIARPPSQPLGTTGSNSQPADRAPSGPISGTPGTPSGNPASPSGSPDAASPSGSAPNPSGQPAAPPKPTDLNRLKIVVNSLAHKHLEDAAREAREMLIDNPGDPQVLKWQAICFARISLGRGEPEAALQYYEKVLRYEDGNREAREFVKNFQRDKKLNSLPFGRYFLKKK